MATTPPGNTVRRDGDEVRVFTLSSYVPWLGRGGHLFGSSLHASLVAIAVWLATIAGEHVSRMSILRWWAIAVAVIAALFRLPRMLVVLCLCAAGAAGGATAWATPVVTTLTECGGVGHLRSDPTPLFGGTQVVVALGDARLKALAHGVAGNRLAQRSAGESVLIHGMCRPLSGNFVRSSRVRHIVGQMVVEEVSEHFAEGAVVMRTANRMRDAMQQGVSRMDMEYRSLFTGLVIGDDRLQSRDMVQRFRDSGLSHLCAASGQNVAYLLAVVAPFIQRRSPRVKWVVTMAVIGWFVLLTRAEPSVIRAGFMAAAVATNALRRHPMNARVVLAMSVICLLLIDPMLAWSIGFALSVGATAGLAWLSAPLGRLFGGRGVLASTLAAQVGTFPISFLVFGSVPMISLIANPLALPVAGVVMTVGLPVSLMAASFPTLVGPVSTVLSLPVMWVDGVARVAASVSPNGAVNGALWCAVGVWVMWRWRSKRGHRLTSVAG